MKQSVVIFIFLISSVLTAQKQSTVGFIENKGQIVDQNSNPNDNVKYLLNTKGLNVQLRKNGFSYDVYESKKIALTQKEQQRTRTSSLPKDDNLLNRNYKLEYRFHRIDIDFVNSNQAVKLVSEGKSTDYDNYYNVVSKPDGILNVHKFQKVTYINIYPNIDVVFFVPEDQSKPVEYNFIVKPNGKIADIQMKFNGAKTELVDDKIKMNLRFGAMEETLPLSWTDEDKKEVGINYKKISKNVYGFASDENIEGKKVVIDPVPNRLWGTYYGGSNMENYTKTLNIDSNDNVISSGETYSNNNIATSGSFQSTNTTGSETGCLIKFNSNGQRLWSTYIRNIIYATQILDIAVSNQNEIYAVGYTWDQDGLSNNITTPGVHKQFGSAFSREGFILKFDSNGQRIWGTFYGGERFDEIRTISIDANQDLIIAGSTYSVNGIATPGAFQAVNTNSISDPLGFFAKFNSNGSLLSGSYFTVVISHSTIDYENKIYFAGQSNSIVPNIATPLAHQTTRNFVDGYLIKFDENWNRLWCTYYGGNASFYISVSDYYDQIMGLGVDILNNVYLIGQTNSIDGIATNGSYKSTQVVNGVDCFIAKFNKNGVRQWGTYFGSDSFFNDYCNDGFVSDNGDVYLGATTRNPNLATPNSFQTTSNGIDTGLLTKFNTNGQLIWSTYYGGNYGDNIQNVAFKDGNIYISGAGGSSSLGTSGTYMPTSLGGDFFIAKFTDCFSSPVVNSVPDICLNGNINLTASGGTNYSWTGPNGFTSNLQNPVILNANSSQSGQYSCAITGTGGCDTTISINVLVGDATKPVPDASILPTINGDCTTVITVPTATDNCAGSINGTTTNPLSYSLPGNYTVTWSYNDGNGNIETQTQNVVISAVSLPTAASSQQFCIQQNATLNDIAITGQNIKWYDAASGGNLLPVNTILQDGISYYASQTVSGCESLRVPVTIDIQNTISPTGTNQSFCATQNATLNDLIIIGTAIKWYASPTSTIELASSTLLADATTYYATQTLNGCESVGRVAITISLIYSLNAVNGTAFICDNQNNGNETVDMSLLTQLMASLAGNTFTYYSSSNGANNLIPSEQLPTNNTIFLGQTIIYVRIDNVNGCYQVVELELTMVSIPVIIMPDEFAFCEGRSVTITAPPGFDFTVWSTNVSAPSITVNQAGDYWLTVGNTYTYAACTTTKNFSVVVSNAPLISSIDIVDWTDNQDSITVNLSADSLGDYEYSIDGETFQNSSIFNGLVNGNYTVTVRDKNGCGEATKEVYILNYPKFFTPNGDGYNDNWYIRFSSFEPNFEVKIFDRYGKLLKVMDNKEFWDGTFNGKLMPSDDYWFNVIRYNGKIHKGHFALKR